MRRDIAATIALTSMKSATRDLPLDHPWPRGLPAARACA
jgi:hypothetical protein